MYALIVASVLIFAVSPALAAEFYVAQDPSTKDCTIVEAKPDGTTMMMVGTSSYPAKEEARAALRAARRTGKCQ
jgi:hypothetical protein